MPKKGDTVKAKAGPGVTAGTSTYARNSVDVVHDWLNSGKPSPLLVLLEAMDEELNDEANKAAGRCARRAAVYANMAAPYFHAKPQAVFNPGAGDPYEMARKIKAYLIGMDESIEAPA